MHYLPPSEKRLIKSAVHICLYLLSFLLKISYEIYIYIYNIDLQETVSLEHC